MISGASEEELIEAIGRADVLLEFMSKIKQLQQENKKLNGAIQTYDILLKANAKENKKLKDNWNKLKEYLHNVDVVVDYSENYDGHFINYDELIDKMQELERSE